MTFATTFIAAITEQSASVIRDGRFPVHLIGAHSLNVILWHRFAAMFTVMVDLASFHNSQNIHRISKTDYLSID